MRLSTLFGSRFIGSRGVLSMSTLVMTTPPPKPTTIVARTVPTPARKEEALKIMTASDSHQKRKTTMRVP
jgi:hypothetical protein